MGMKAASNITITFRGEINAFHIEEEERRDCE
jgi:hypothetical protein